MFDRIEAGTYLIAAAVTQGNLKIKMYSNVIQTEIDVLKKLVLKFLKNEIHIIGNRKIKSVNIKTAPYQDFQLICKLRSWYYIKLITNH